MELIAEIRAGLEDDDEVPSAELADQAVAVVIRGDRNRVVVKSARSSDEGDASVDVDGGGHSPLWVIFGVVVGLATIAAAVFGGFRLLR